MSSQKIDMSTISGRQIPMPTINCNRDAKPVETIRKYANTPHGMTLLAIYMMDAESKAINIDVEFENISYLHLALEQIINTWHVFEPIKSFIRSYCIDGKFLDEFDGFVLCNNRLPPGS